MKPFVLKQHDKAQPILRALQEQELKRVYGGFGPPGRTKKLSTITSTPNGDGGDDGADAG